MEKTTVQLPVPREGVAGSPRTDWLLELDTEAMPHRDALAAMAFHLQRATLVGTRAPIVQQMWDRISAPRVGDLVVESTYYFPNRDMDHRAKSLGILLAHREEWAQTDEEWAAEAEADRACNRENGYEPDLGIERARETDAWYIQYGNDAVDVCRWTNCTFYAIPTDFREFRP